MCISALSAGLSMYHVHAVPVTDRRRHQVPWGWGYRQLQAVMWVLGIEPSPLKEQLVLLTAESLLQSQDLEAQETASKCVCVYMSLCLYLHMYVQVPAEGRREHQIP